MGFEPTFFSVTGRRALQAAPRGHLEGRVGIEPTTRCLTGNRSTTELPTHFWFLVAPERDSSLGEIISTDFHCHAVAGDNLDPVFSDSSANVSGDILAIVQLNHESRVGKCLPDDPDSFVYFGAPRDNASPEKSCSVLVAASVPGEGVKPSF